MKTGLAVTDTVLVLELVAVVLFFCGLSYWIGRRSH